MSLTRQLSFWGPTIVPIVSLPWLHGILPPFVAGLAPVCLLMIATAVVAFHLI